MIVNFHGEEEEVDGWHIIFTTELKKTKKTDKPIKIQIVDDDAHVFLPVDYYEVEWCPSVMAATQVEGAVDDWVNEAVRHSEEENSWL